MRRQTHPRLLRPSFVVFLENYPSCRLIAEENFTSLRQAFAAQNRIFFNDAQTFVHRVEQFVRFRVRQLELAVQLHHVDESHGAKERARDEHYRIKDVQDDLHRCQRIKVGHVPDEEHLEDLQDRDGSEVSA